MRGHESIIALRRQGLRPKSLDIWAGVDATEGWKHWPAAGAHAEVEIHDDEQLSGLDLRFTVGMLVFVSGQCPFRVAAIHAGCLRAGARRVVSAAVQFDAQRPLAPGVVGRVLDSATEAVCTS